MLRLRNQAHAACTIYVSSYYTCVRILYMCPHTIYVSAGARHLPTAQRSICSVYYICVLILYVSAYYICVLRSSPSSDCATKHMQRVLYMCPHTIYVSAYYICVLILSAGARQLPTAQRSICSARASHCRYSVYLLYQHKSTKTDTPSASAAIDPTDPLAWNGSPPPPSERDPPPQESSSPEPLSLSSLSQQQRLNLSLATPEPPTAALEPPTAALLKSGYGDDISWEARYIY
jgi:hypothetical protein